MAEPSSSRDFVQLGLDQLLNSGFDQGEDAQLVLRVQRLAELAFRSDVGLHQARQLAFAWIEESEERPS